MGSLGFFCTNRRDFDMMVVVKKDDKAVWEDGLC